MSSGTQNAAPIDFQLQAQDRKGVTAGTRAKDSPSPPPSSISDQDTDMWYHLDMQGLQPINSILERSWPGGRLIGDPLSRFRLPTNHLVLKVRE